MQHPDEGTIHAWLDGELSVDDAAALEAHVAGCAECRAAVAEVRGIIAASSRIVSALDVVPGGVIPAVAPRRRPWYASTQVRAAAAVLVVAGTTLLVMNREDTSFTRTAVRDTTAALIEREQNGALREQVGAMTAPVDMDATAQKQEPARAKSTLPVPGASASVEQGRGAERATRKPTPATANQAAAKGTQAPVNVAEIVRAEARLDEVTIVAPRVTPSQQTLNTTVAGRDTAVRDEARDRRTVRTSPVTALSGAASGVAIAIVPDLKELRTDTTGNTRRTIYEVSPGVQVTLTEIEPVAFGAPAAARRNAARETPASPPAAAPAAVSTVQTSAAAGTKPVISITWSDSTTARSYVLSGPLTKAELEVIRQRLAAQKR